MVRVRTEVESRAGLAAEGRGEAAQEMLGFEERDLLAMFGEREPGGEPTDAAAEHDGMAQEDAILKLSALTRRQRALYCPVAARSCARSSSSSLSWRPYSAKSPLFSAACAAL